jgi:hypothetical protein
MRYCAIYECKICEFKSCYYCLIDYSKRKLIQNITGIKEEEVKISRRVEKDINIKVNQSEKKPYTSANQNSTHNSVEGASIADISALFDGFDARENYSQVCKHFGKYTEQYIEFQSWPCPREFFLRQENWIKSHGRVHPYDYMEYADRSPIIHQPDRLELELISIRKHNNYIYEGQVLVNSQNFHGFGRILQF